MPADPSPTAVPATARVFGHEPVAVTLELIPRTTGWRLGRTLRYLIAGAVAAPVLGVLPPHAPWAVAAGAGGTVLALRKWRERFTLVGMEAVCPRCGAALDGGRSVPLRDPHRISCDGCGNPVIVSVDPEVLPTP
ncbi:MAG: hypothetical protein HKO98_01965 [Gemmatimonadetes bacterium]|nr:hypothetical protein [Gemmatimonadota bacterium]